MDSSGWIGKLLGGRYRIARHLGTGAMGAVFLAQHEVLQRPFAVKILRHELAEDPRLCRRFQREARAASRIQHPNIVYISDFGTTEDRSLYLVMEYIPGRNLREELTTTGPLPMARALRVLIQLADALGCAHQAQVIHRDLKPDNLLLTEHRGKPDHVKVLDFGVAKILEDEAVAGPQLSARGELFGTPLYMAPEQFTGQPVGPHTDIYALGVVGYELVTGTPPFSGSLATLMLAHTRTAPEPPSRRKPGAGISPAFDAVIGRCLAKAASERYASAAELENALLGLYRIASGRSRAATRPEDTDHSSPLAHLTLWDDVTGGTEDRTQSGSHRAGGVSAEAERALHDRLVRELAEALRDEGLGSLELAVVLARLVQSEERMFAEQAEIALAEAQIGETDQTIDGREGRIRYAMLQLRQERERWAGEGSVEVKPTLAGATLELLVDLEAQIAELEQRLLELAQERSDRIQALEARLVAHRSILDELEARQRVDSERLLALVLEARPAVTNLDLMNRYLRLEEVRSPR